MNNLKKFLINKLHCVPKEDYEELKASKDLLSKKANNFKSMIDVLETEIKDLKKKVNILLEEDEGRIYRIVPKQYTLKTERIVPPNQNTYACKEYFEDLDRLYKEDVVNSLLEDIKKYVFIREEEDYNGAKRYAAYISIFPIKEV